MTNPGSAPIQHRCESAVDLPISALLILYQSGILQIAKNRQNRRLFSIFAENLEFCAKRSIFLPQDRPGNFN